MLISRQKNRLFRPRITALITSLVSKMGQLWKLWNKKLANRQLSIYVNETCVCLKPGAETIKSILHETSSRMLSTSPNLQSLVRTHFDICSRCFHPRSRYGPLYNYDLRYHRSHSRCSRSLRSRCHRWRSLLMKQGW